MEEQIMKNNKKPTDKAWIRIMCGALAALMVIGIVFMLAQMFV